MPSQRKKVSAKRESKIISEVAAGHSAENLRHECYLDCIIQGDNLTVLKSIPNNTINLVVTSPPYFKQRDYGSGIGNEKTVAEYVDNLIDVFSECVRVLSDEGSIVFNLGDKYLDGSLQLIPYSFALMALKTCPVKLVNNITWIKPNPTPRRYQKKLINSVEPFFHFVKSNEYHYNLKDYLACSEIKIKKYNGTNIGRRYFEQIENSAITLEQKKMAFCELQDVIEEVKLGKIEGFRMKIKGIHSEPYGGQGGGRKYQLLKKGFTIIKIKGEPLKKDVIECAVETTRGRGHPAIYPLHIIRELIKLLSKPNDVVLDPFVGSGTTAIAAKELNRKYIGIEINGDYCKQAKERLKNLSLLNDAGDI